LLNKEEQKAVLDKLGLTGDDLVKWKSIMENLNLNINDEGIIEQFMGYFDLEELDWEYFRDKYKDIHRLDRILKAEGKSPDEYKLAKQADLIMLFYNLGFETATEIIKGLGYRLPPDYIGRNFEYYMARTSHGSTLSRLVHARIAHQLGNEEMGWEMYQEALKSDLVDIQGGTTGEGIHCGVMGGTVYSTLSTYTGLDISGNHPRINPQLPPYWKGITFRFGFRKDHFRVEITRENVEIVCEESQNEKIKVHICDQEWTLKKGKTETIIYQ
jgi:trehalose/maltose hydrolase-like predicted phosphorylase